MTWTYKGKQIDEIGEEYIGFVYCITNTINGRKYIGKKQSIKKITRPPLKNKTRRRITYAESDWKEYYGSSEELQKDINTHGKENFKREILHFCKSKGELSYIELREQMDRRVLETDEYYNGIIQVKIHKRHVKSPSLWIQRQKGK
jgi:spermidine/putrescine-binding protein